MLYSRFTTNDLIQFLNDFFREHKKRPTKRAWRGYAIERQIPSVTTIQRVFGNWSKALVAAGLPAPTQRPTPQSLQALGASLGKNRHWRANYKGGRHKAAGGYIKLWIPDAEPIKSRAHHGSGRYKLEHRVVMERVLGRPLDRWEFVHHKNGIKDDNRPENLEIVLPTTHRGQVRCPHCQETFCIR